MKLSKRLLNCAHFTAGFNKLADIGTDHALLPIYCIKEGLVSNVLAIDNKEGPYLIALTNVKKHGYEKQVEVLLGNGIQKITDDVDVVVIAGMGGILISKILQMDPLKNVQRLILQPNSDTYAIRKILKHIGFKIVEEVVLLDSQKLYDVIVLERGIQELSKLEEIFGPINLREKPYFFTLRIEKELEHLHKIEALIHSKDEKIQLLARIKLLEEALQ